MSHILVEQAVESSQHSELECLYLTERALGNIPRHRHTLAVLDRLDTITLPKLAFIQLSLLFCCYLGQQQPLSALPFNQLSLYLWLRICYIHTLLDLCSVVQSDYDHIKYAKAEVFTLILSATSQNRNTLPLSAMATSHSEFFWFLSFIEWRRL